MGFNAKYPGRYLERSCVDGHTGRRGKCAKEGGRNTSETTPLLKHQRQPFTTLRGLVTALRGLVPLRGLRAFYRQENYQVRIVPSNNNFQLNCLETPRYQHLGGKQNTRFFLAGYNCFDMLPADYWRMSPCYCCNHLRGLGSSIHRQWAFLATSSEGSAPTCWHDDILTCWRNAYKSRRTSSYIFSECDNNKRCSSTS